MYFVLFGTVSQCCDATSILDGIIAMSPKLKNTTEALHLVWVSLQMYE